jgi:hypothetical protein
MNPQLPEAHPERPQSWAAFGPRSCTRAPTDVEFCQGTPRSAVKNIAFPTLQPWTQPWASQVCVLNVPWAPEEAGLGKTGTQSSLWVGLETRGEEVHT